MFRIMVQSETKVLVFKSVLLFLPTGLHSSNNTKACNYMEGSGSDTIK